MRSGEEPVEVVDLDGRVIEVVTRREMRRRKLRHRSTYVVVLRPDARIVVHQRADWKDVYPGFWDLAFGGVCAVGESWLASARRELAEEAGLSGVELIDRGGGRYDGPEGHIVARVFTCVTDGSITATDGEVVAVDEVPITELDGWLDNHLVCPDSLHLLAGRLGEPLG